ncbi:MAG: glycosyltransferase [Aquificae bacterium]|nr:glycosyltransferase [Aquificota bacterium]
MKIGILSRWNATCGVSLHAEMVGRELLRRGYEITVFAPYKESANRWWHHKLIREDEPFVVRCYEETSPDGREGRLDIGRVLSSEIDVLIVESYEKLPYGDVERLVALLRDRGVPSIVVIHEGLPEDVRYSDLNLFERIVVFDERFLREVLGNRVNKEKVEVIPYPCYPVREGKRRFAQDGRIRFFSFGRQPREEYCPYLEALKVFRKKSERPFLYRVVRASELLRFWEEWFEQEEGVLDYEDIVRELHSSDFHLLPKGNTRRVVVSSTLYQVLGTLTITFVPDNRFFETLPRGEKAPVVFYGDVEDLLEKIQTLCREEELRERIRENARRFVEENEVGRITDRFEALINSVLLKDVN